MQDQSKVTQLSTFLKRVQQLRGYGDMDSYCLVNEFKSLVNVPENTVHNIIQDLSSPQTWNFGKSKFIDKVENVIEDIFNS